MEETTEAQRPKKVNEPKTPTAADRYEDEFLGHIVFRSWCPHCVANRGRAQGHPQTDPSAEDDLPEACIDYCFMGDENETIPYLAGVDRKSGAYLFSS